ncbi:hypothetical protein BAE44_0018282 [Dichanthelium oligosanthes]|uniref:Uncharacterized protein n=1 Tax=Dichanthelium oligosanthes TaxID=888268 RepID=A0A1E5V6A3_9POAL|nr:hypothetical protein BAE44_0018282 [Dichanthelium oligosanthes]
MNPKDFIKFKAVCQDWHIISRSCRVRQFVSCILKIEDVDGYGAMKFVSMVENRLFYVILISTLVGKRSTLIGCDRFVYILAVNKKDSQSTLLLNSLSL